MIAAIYARKSTEQHGVSDDQKSVARQIDHGRAFATSKARRPTHRREAPQSRNETVGAVLRLMNALKPRAAAERRLRTDSERLSGAPRLDARIVRGELLALAADWRRVLASDTMHARPLLATLLHGRVRFTPMSGRHEWQLQGKGTIAGLFTRLVSATVPLGGTSPAGFAPQWTVDFLRKFRAA